jgi:hypothetical protein
MDQEGFLETICRCMYHAQARPGQEDACAGLLKRHLPAFRARLDAGQVLTASAFRWRAHYFLFYETVDHILAPQELLGGVEDVLLAWPGLPWQAGQRFFVPLMDIFHCVAPAGLQHWRRKQPPERIHARLARLKPEMVSSYIFHHYQLQEERPGSFDKYCLIGLQENWLFFYLEHPFVVETPPAPGKLNTANTPADWQAAMNPHFMLWEDARPGQEIWRDIETVFALF